MGFFKKVFRPVRKIAKKIIPKEIRPFLPYIAAGFGVPTAGLTFGTGLGSALAQRGLIAAATSAATDEQGNPLRAGILAAAPGAIQGSLGQFGKAYGTTPALLKAQMAGEPTTSSFLQNLGTQATKLSQNKTLQTLADPRNASGLANKAIAYGTPASIDQSAKFAEIRQDEIDEYNRNLLEQGVASKVDRRNAIFGIYKNAGYDDDYVNTMLDTYGYAGGGRIGFAEGLGIFDDENYLENASRGYKGAKASMKNFFSKDKEDEEEREPVITKNKKGQFVFNFPEKEDKNNLAGHLATAMDGVQKAYGRSFGEMEPVPMMRFARGGEVEIEEQTDDLGIMDLMRDQGVEYDEQVSNAQNDELLEKLFEEFLDLGFSPEDAAKKAREAFDDMSQGQGIKGTQVASGYKDDIEEMYEQYVFEMEEQGLQPMDFASYLRQARSGMASGGSVGSRYSFLINKYNKGIPLTPSEEDELEMLEMTYADDSQGKAEGGIMNRNLLNTGMDKDMRGGGFIPEGTKEKADDVPARLSKNEFVMTADAVRAAGGGSVNEGAKRMYDTMHKLEAKV